MSRDSHSKASKMKLGGDLFDDSQSDSGVSADFSPDSTVELQTTTSTPTLTSPPADETPIEREIRRAVQREQSLRRSRGLHNKPPTQEYVDIPLRKSVLTETLPSKSDKSQGGKDRQFAGKKMQKEISVETQREQVLVQLGKVKGSYDKGTVRQLKERKKLFEAFQEPKGTSSMVLSHSKAPSWASASDLSTLEIQGNDASSVSFVEGSFGERRRSSLELMCQTQNQSPSGTPKGITYIPHGAPVPRGPTLSESTGGQIIILDSHHHLVLPAPAHIHHVSKPLRHSHSTGALTETQGLTVVDSASMYSSTSTLSGEERRGFWRDEDGGRMDQEEEEEEEEVPKENPFFKLRSSSVSQDKVEQDIREAREREKELQRQRSSLYGGGGGGGGGRPASREVQSPTSPPPLLLQNGLVTPELSVTPSSRTASATPTARQSLGKLGMWPPPQTDEYPDCQSEGLQSPRTPRQKTPLLQRWESGQVMNGHGWEEED